jgi:hypothetical protein
VLIRREYAIVCFDIGTSVAFEMFGILERQSKTFALNCTFTYVYFGCSLGFFLRFSDSVV